MVPESWFYWQAFHYLRGSGQTPYGRRPIPFSEIAAYADWQGMTCPVEKARLARVIIAMDNAERAAGDKG